MHYDQVLLWELVNGAHQLGMQFLKLSTHIICFLASILVYFSLVCEISSRVVLLQDSLLFT